MVVGRTLIDDVTLMQQNDLVEQVVHIRRRL